MLKFFFTHLFLLLTISIFAQKKINPSIQNEVNSSRAFENKNVSSNNVNENQIIQKALGAVIEGILIPQSNPPAQKIMMPQLNENNQPIKPPKTFKIKSDTLSYSEEYVPSFAGIPIWGMGLSLHPLFTNTSLELVEKNPNPFGCMGSLGLFAFYETRLWNTLNAEATIRLQQSYFWGNNHIDYPLFNQSVQESETTYKQIVNLNAGLKLKIYHLENKRRKKQKKIIHYSANYFGAGLFASSSQLLATGTLNTKLIHPFFTLNLHYGLRRSLSNRFVVEFDFALGMSKQLEVENLQPNLEISCKINHIW